MHEYIRQILDFFIYNRSTVTLVCEVLSIIIIFIVSIKLLIEEKDIIKKIIIIIVSIIMIPIVTIFLYFLYALLIGVIVFLSTIIGIVLIFMMVLFILL